MAELLEMVEWPERTIPDPKRRENCRYLIGKGIVAVVNEEERSIITVGLDGADHHDWRTMAARRPELPPGA